jgi:hypothetical protein
MSCILFIATLTHNMLSRIRIRNKVEPCKWLSIKWRRRKSFLAAVSISTNFAWRRLQEDFAKRKQHTGTLHLNSTARYAYLGKRLRVYSVILHTKAETIVDCF